jgi:hypothetical protein
VEEEDDQMEFVKYFPVFVLVVRDFTLDLEINKKPITEDEYLETALQLRKGIGKSVSDYNLPRECIRRYFPKRKCFIFSIPTEDGKLSKNRKQLPDGELKDEFQHKMDIFSEFIYSDSEPKMVDSSLVNGRSFASLTRSYVEALPKGPICIESAVETMARAENEKVAEEALDIYKKEFQDLVKLPTDTEEEMSKADVACRRKALEHFCKFCICDHNMSYRTQFMGRLSDSYQHFQSMNTEMSRVRCSELIKRLYSPIRCKNYMRVGGHKSYQADIDQLKTQYDADKCKGLVGDIMWNEFMTQEIPFHTQILEADKTITEAQKKLEGEKLKREDAERRFHAAKEDAKKAEQALGDKTDNLRQEMSWMREQLERADKLRYDELRKALEAQKTEYEQLMKKGLAEKAEELAKFMKHHKKQLAKAEKETEANRDMLEKAMQSQVDQHRMEFELLKHELRQSYEQNPHDRYSISFSLFPSSPW